MITYIYGLADPRNNEIRYIGKTVKPIKYRLSAHISVAKRGIDLEKNHKNSWIMSLLNEGITPTIILLEEAGENWADREKYWISKYDNLTNMSVGGEAGSLGVKQSKKIVEKRISTIKKKIKNGEIDYTERAKKIAKANTGKKVKESTKEKLRKINLGKKYSLESRMKKGKGGVLQFTKNGILINKFNTLSEAQEKTGFLRGNISSACTGRLHTYKNYVWRYVNEDMV